MASGKVSMVLIYRNQGRGTFVSWATLTVAASPHPTAPSTVVLSLAFGDYDNDGDLDLAVGVWGAADRLFRNDGLGNWVEDTGTSFDDVTRQTNAVGWAE